MHRQNTILPDKRKHPRQEDRREVPLSPNYEGLYHQMFNAVTDLIEAMKSVQQQAEEVYIEQSSSVPVPDYIQIIK